MIVKENIEIGGKDFVKQYSDSGFYIERDGEEYWEAIDLTDIPREYIETNVPIDEGFSSDEENKQKAEAFDYLTGRSDSNE